MLQKCEGTQPYTADLPVGSVINFQHGEEEIAVIQPVNELPDRLIRFSEAVSTEVLAKQKGRKKSYPAPLTSRYRIEPSIEEE